MNINILKIIVIIFSLNIVSPAFATLIEGKDYLVLDGPETEYSVHHEKIEVIEFFSYGCPYCYILEPELALWQEEKPENVVFTRIAIPRKGRWIEYARLFYSLDMISVQEQERILPLIYSAIHEQKINLDDADKIIDWVAEQGIDRDMFTQYYHSQQVTDKLSEALELAQYYNLKYVPSIYVNNEYQLLLDSSNNYQNTKDKLNELIKIVEQSN